MRMRGREEKSRGADQGRASVDHEPEAAARARAKNSSRRSELGSGASGRRRDRYRQRKPLCRSTTQSSGRVGATIWVYHGGTERDGGVVEAMRDSDGGDAVNRSVLDSSI